MCITLVSYRHLRRKIKQSTNETLQNIAVTNQPSIQNALNLLKSNLFAVNSTHFSFPFTYDQNVESECNFGPEVNPADSANSLSRELYAEEFTSYNNHNIKLNNTNISCPSQTQIDLEFYANFNKWACGNSITHKSLNEILSLIKPRCTYCFKYT